MSDDLFEEEDRTNAAEDLRVKLEAANKKAAKAEREAEELRTENQTFKAERRQAQVTSVLTEAKLDPSWSGLFLKDNPDAEIDEAAVTGWAQKYNLAPKAPEPVEQVADTTQPQVPAPPPFVPQVQGGGSTDAEISPEEWKAAVTSGDREKHDWAVGLSDRGLVRW